MLLLLGNGLFRGLWKLGRVERLITDKDEIIRSAVVMSTTPKGKATKLRRPVERLYLQLTSIKISKMIFYD